MFNSYVNLPEGISNIIYLIDEIIEMIYRNVYIIHIFVLHNRNTSLGGVIYTFNDIHASSRYI